MKTLGVKTSTTLTPARLTKAPKRARDTRAAEPMAKPWKMQIKNQVLTWVVFTSDGKHGFHAHINVIII